MDVVLLSRIQFALNIATHYLFPPTSIGLGICIVIMEGMYIKTNNPKFRVMAQFWTRMFGLVFALGVASGVVQVFAFGNNWARYSRFVGDVFGSALAAEGVFAFMLEAGFLGLMMFGWDRVKKGVHYFSTIMVVLGAHFSAVWIIIVNSWMQTPRGYRIIGEGLEARAVVTNWWEMAINYSTVDRLIHVLLGAYLTGAFVVISVSAFYMLRKRHTEFAHTSMRVGMIVACVCVILQLFSADASARTVVKHQPAKLAAMEGIFNKETPTPFVVWGYVDREKKETIGWKIPGLLSLLSYRKLDKAAPALSEFPESDWPPVPIVFQTYRIMIYAWGLMVLASFWCLIQFCRKKINNSPLTLFCLCFSVGLPYLANQCGWYTAEIGRQPWLVYNVLTTKQGITRSITSGMVTGSLIMFICIWATLLSLFFFLLTRKIMHGPEDTEDDAIYTDPYLNQKGV
jgi:cytochrome bd ubiquinol oxidase subunit I